MANTFTPEQVSQILAEFFKVVGTRQYIGARYVPIFGRKEETSIQWDNSAPYEPLTIVLYQGNSYTSRQYVPAGVDITNAEFWALTGNYNAQIETYRHEVENVGSNIDSVTQATEKNATDIAALETTTDTLQTKYDNMLAGTSESGLKSLIDTNTGNIAKNTGDIAQNAGDIANNKAALDGTAASGLKTMIEATNSNVETHTEQLAGNQESGLKNKIDTVAGNLNELVERLYAGLGAFTTPNFGIKDRHIVGSTANGTSAQGFCIFEQDGVIYYAQGAIGNDTSKLIIRNPNSNTEVSTLSNVNFGHMHGISYNPNLRQLVIDASEDGNAKVAIVNVSNPYMPSFSGVLPFIVSNATRACYFKDSKYAVMDMNYTIWIVENNTATELCTFYNEDGQLGVTQELSYFPDYKIFALGCTMPNGICIFDESGARLNAIHVPYFIGHTRAREIEGAYVFNNTLYVNAFDRVDGAALATLYWYDFERGTQEPTETVNLVTAENTTSAIVNEKTGSLINPKDNTYALFGDALTHTRDFSNVNLYMDGDEYSWYPIVNYQQNISLRANAAFKFLHYITVSHGAMEIASQNITFTADSQVSSGIGAAIRASRSNIQIAQPQNKVVGTFATNRLIHAVLGTYIANGAVTVPWSADKSIVAGIAASISNLTATNCAVSTLA